MDTVSIQWRGQIITLPVRFRTDDDEAPSERQRQALTDFLDRQADILDALEGALVEYYLETRAEAFHHYEHEYATRTHPDARDIEALAPMFRFTLVLVDYDWADEAVAIGLIADCDWDEELGVGIRVVDGTIDEIGVQDIAI
jgi:hypothetical protein